MHWAEETNTVGALSAILCDVGLMELCQHNVFKSLKLEDLKVAAVLCSSGMALVLR